jgi:phenylalanyl-tRNA synthetase beta chain
MDVKGPAWPSRSGRPRCRCRARPARPAAALALNDLQAVERDFAFVVDADVEALTLVNAAAGADKALIETVRVFDEFIGGSAGRGQEVASPSPCVCSRSTRP